MSYRRRLKTCPSCQWQDYSGLPALRPSGHGDKKHHHV